MKRILIAAAMLLACVQAFAQNTCAGSWCMSGVTMQVNGQNVTTVAPGATVSITVAFTSTADASGMTLGVSIFDPTKTQIQGAGVWLPGNAFTAGQTITTPFTFTTPNTPGTYAIAAGVWSSDGTNPLWDAAAQTFVVNAPAPTAAGPPSCYPPAAMAFTVSVTSIAPATAPAFIVSWFCPDPAGQSGYSASGFYGYISELAPDWSAQYSGFDGASKTALDAAWKKFMPAEVPNDLELKPLWNAQVQRTWPPSITYLRGSLPAAKTSGTTVYYVIQQAGRFVNIPVGTAPIGTTCDSTQLVNGMASVPTSAVTWFGAVKPLVVIAPCS